MADLFNSLISSKNVKSEPVVERSNKKYKKRFQSGNAWLQQMKVNQKPNFTPEMQQKIKVRSEKRRRLKKKCKRAKVYERSAKVQKMAWAQGNVRALRCAPARAMEAVETSAQQMNALRNVYAEAYDEEDEEAEDRMEAQLDLLESAQIQDEIGVVDDKGMSSILEQLRREPTKDEEMMAKFKLYEEFLKNVEKSRKATHDFWKDCKDEFAEAQGNVCRDVERSLKDIDNEENLAIVFNERRWFVYDMTVKADSNNDKIEAVLKTIERKLEMLQKNDDCPFCLESPSDDVPFVTLGCCHKACEECWTNWQELRGHGAFCPLCREEDFITTVMTS